MAGTDLQLLTWAIGLTGTSVSINSQEAINRLLED